MKPPVHIEVAQQFGMFGRVGQYSGLESVAATETKMAQYPRGTAFELYAPRESKLLGEIRRFAAEKGFIVTSR